MPTLLTKSSNICMENVSFFYIMIHMDFIKMARSVLDEEKALTIQLLYFFSFSNYNI